MAFSATACADGFDDADGDDDDDDDDDDASLASSACSMDRWSVAGKQASYRPACDTVSRCAELGYMNLLLHQEEQGKQDNNCACEGR